MAKQTGKFTRIHGEDYATVEGIIAITRALAVQYPDEPRIKSFLAWIEGLGRVPTSAEFEVWAWLMGFALRKGEE